MKTVGDYHDLYLKQMFCYWKMYLSSLEKYSSKIDPCYYFSSPGLSWNTMSSKTNAEPELMTEVNMYQFIEKIMKGGVNYIE